MLSSMLSAGKCIPTQLRQLICRSGACLHESQKILRSGCAAMSAMKICWKSGNKGSCHENLQQRICAAQSSNDFNLNPHYTYENPSSLHKELPQRLPAAGASPPLKLLTQGQPQPLVAPLPGGKRLSNGFLTFTQLWASSEGNRSQAAKPKKGTSQVARSRGTSEDSETEMCVHGTKRQDGPAVSANTYLQPVFFSARRPSGIQQASWHSLLLSPAKLRLQHSEK